MSSHFVFLLTALSDLYCIRLSCNCFALDSASSFMVIHDWVDVFMTNKELINPVSSAATISSKLASTFIHSTLVSKAVVVYCFSLSYIFIENSSNANGKDDLDAHPVSMIKANKIIREYLFIEEYKLKGCGTWDVELGQYFPFTLSLVPFICYLNKHIDNCQSNAEDYSKDKWSDINFIFVWMIFFVSELYTCNDVSKHCPTKNQIAWHYYLFDHKLIFWSEKHASSQKKKSYKDRKEEKNSFYYLKECVHSSGLIS